MELHLTPEPQWGLRGEAGRAGCGEVKGSRKSGPGRGPGRLCTSAWQHSGVAEVDRMRSCRGLSRDPWVGDSELGGETMGATGH